MIASEWRWPLLITNSCFRGGHVATLLCLIHVHKEKTMVALFLWFATTSLCLFPFALFLNFCVIRDVKTVIKHIVMACGAGLLWGGSSLAWIYGAIKIHIAVQAAVYQTSIFWTTLILLITNPNRRDFNWITYLSLSIIGTTVGTITTCTPPIYQKLLCTASLGIDALRDHLMGKCLSGVDNTVRFRAVTSYTFWTAVTATGVCYFTVFGTSTNGWWSTLQGPVYPLYFFLPYLFCGIGWLVTGILLHCVEDGVYWDPTWKRGYDHPSSQMIVTVSTLMIWIWLGDNSSAGEVISLSLASVSSFLLSVWFCAYWIEGPYSRIGSDDHMEGGRFD